MHPSSGAPTKLISIPRASLHEFAATGEAPLSRTSSKDRVSSTPGVREAAGGGSFVIPALEGRERETVELVYRLSGQLVNGEPGAVLMCGRSGVGKSATVVSFGGDLPAAFVGGRVCGQ
jgi:hypothetical protein